MKIGESKAYKVLLQKMTPVYTLVTVTAANEDAAAQQALESAEEFSREFSHDRLPADGVWSLIPPVDIFMPAEDGEPEVLGVCAGDVDAAELKCWGSKTVTGDGEIVDPHFMQSGLEKEVYPMEDAL